MTTMTMFALTEPEERGQNFFFYGISEALQLHEVYIMSVNDIPATTLRRKVKKSKYLIFQQCSLNQKDETHYMRLSTDKSKIFQTGTRFDIPKDILDDFYNPKMCTIPEALASPKKRRLSVEGTVVQIYPIKEGQNWKRRDVITVDPPTTKKICCKLWNTHADSIKDEDNGSTATFKNMEVDIYNERHQLRTTSLSSLTLMTHLLLLPVVRILFDKHRSVLEGWW